MTSDSAGRPWHGRTLPGTGFAEDVGAVDPALAAALAAEAPDETGRITALLTALMGARLLVPVVAAPTGVEPSGGLSAETFMETATETSADMAVITITVPDGRRGLPVFSGLQPLTAWRPQARPVPVPGVSAAQAAIAEGCDVLLLDLGTPHAYVLRSSMMWALAQRRGWLPAHEDPCVTEALERAVASEAAVTSAATGPGLDDAPESTTVTLHVIPGLRGEQVQALANRVGERLASDEESRARIDSLSIRLVPG